MRIRDWYFQGWERGADGALVYAGEYYTLPAGRARPAALGLTGALAALYLTAALWPSAGGMWRWAAIPQLLELIPLIYLVLGAACLLRAKQPMTFRDWYASWRRMRTAAAWSAGFTAGMTAVEVVYIVLSAAWDGAEALFLLRVAGCAALSVWLLWYLRAHPCTRSVTK